MTRSWIQKKKEKSNKRRFRDESNKNRIWEKSNENRFAGKSNKNCFWEKWNKNFDNFITLQLLKFIANKNQLKSGICGGGEGVNWEHYWFFQSLAIYFTIAQFAIFSIFCNKELNCLEKVTKASADL